MMASHSRIDLPVDVVLRSLTLHCDRRGTFGEIFRTEWNLPLSPVQWSVSASESDVLRGVHVHLRHYDYVTVVQGRAAAGLRDLRPGSPTEGQAVVLELRGDDLTALLIPPGVAHGFYFRERSIYLLGTSEYWDPDDELGCYWADPALGIAWPATPGCVSERDERLPPFRALAARIPPWGTQSACQRAVEIGRVSPGS